jgi:hypothetical protein
MVLQMRNRSRIDNPREYAASVVDELRHVLRVGGRARRDPHRENFYDLECGNDNYYIHISPISGNVTLLAKWLRQQNSTRTEEVPLVAWL